MPRARALKTCLTHKTRTCSPLLFGCNGELRQERSRSGYFSLGEGRPFASTFVMSKHFFDQMLAAVQKAAYSIADWNWSGAKRDQARQAYEAQSGTKGCFSLCFKLKNTGTYEPCRC